LLKIVLDKIDLQQRPDETLNILQTIVEDPRVSFRKVIQQHDIGP